MAPTERPPVNVAVGRFDDIPARGLHALVEEDASLALVARDVAPAQVSAVIRARRPDVMILDAGLLHSPVQVRELTTAHPSTRLLLLAERPTSVESAQLLAFGASACLAKAIQARDVLSAIHLASRGIQLIPMDPAGSAHGSGLLTARESDVLAQLQRRRSNAQIAADLHIGIETVRTHARNIYRKLGVASRRELLLASPPSASRPR